MWNSGRTPTCFGYPDRTGVDGRFSPDRIHPCVRQRRDLQAVRRGPSLVEAAERVGYGHHTIVHTAARRRPWGETEFRKIERSTRRPGSRAEISESYRRRPEKSPPNHRTREFPGSCDRTAAAAARTRGRSHKNNNINYYFCFGRARPCSESIVKYIALNIFVRCPHVCYG